MSLWQEISSSFRHKDTEHLSLESVKDLDSELSFVAKKEIYCIAYEYFLREKNTFSLIRDSNDLWR